MKTKAFEHLFAVNSGFDQVVRNLMALKKHRCFAGIDLDRYVELSKETRAATNSRLLGVMEMSETDEAGRRFRQRRKRESREE